MKKIILHCEPVYMLAILILSFSVATLTASDLGLSSVAATPYIISLKLGFITFGQSEYIVQAILFITFCVCMRKFKLVYLSSFLTAVIYGAVLDMWRAVIPPLNPNVTDFASYPLYVKIGLFVFGMLTTSIAIALFFHTYLYPQVYDFFVKGLAVKFKLDRTKFKIIFDLSALVISVTLSILLFGGFIGIGVGTIIVGVLNGVLIGVFDKLFSKWFDFVPIFPKFAALFDLEK